MRTGFFKLRRRTRFHGSVEKMDSRDQAGKEIGLLDGISSLRSVRQFKPDRVPEEIVGKVLRAATMAASGSNTQPWEFIVVQDAKVKRLLRDPMLEKWLERMRSSVNQNLRGVYDEATEMVRNTERVPVLVYCCLNLENVSHSEEVRYSSIYPAVQNLMLAAHSFGLGTCLTVHGSTSTRGEPEVKKILGIPDNVKVACLVYMGYPTRSYGRPKRKPVKEHTHFDRW